MSKLLLQRIISSESGNPKTIGYMAAFKQPNTLITIGISVCHKMDEKVFKKTISRELAIQRANNGCLDIDTDTPLLIKNRIISRRCICPITLKDVFMHFCYRANCYFHNASVILPNVKFV